MEGFICLPLSPFICLPLSPSLDAWHGSLGGRVHLSPFVSLHLSPVASQPGCLARLSGLCFPSFVSLCLPWLCFPSFVSRCLPAWMSGTALWALFPFICLPLSPSLDVWHGSPGGQIHLSPFVSLHLSPVVSQPGCLARLFGWTVSLVSLCLPSLAPLVSQPGCLSRLSRRTDSLVSLGSPSFVSHLCGWTD